MWAREDECSEIIDKVWFLGYTDGLIGAIMTMITKCGLHLTQWNKIEFGNV